MTFNSINISQISAQIIPSPALGVPSSPVHWSYFTSDPIATVAGSGYFINNATYTPYSFWIKVGDYIYCNCSNGVIELTVNAISPSITTIPIPVGSNTISNLQLDPMEIQYAKVPLTSGQFNNMFNSAMSMVPAAGAHTILVPMEVDFEIIYGGTPLVGGGNIGLQWGSAAALGGVIASAEIATTVSHAWNANSFYRINGLLSTTFASTIVNAGLYLSCDTENFFLGNSSYNVYIKYYVISNTTI
jgi:hypothetical protein